MTGIGLALPDVTFVNDILAGSGDVFLGVLGVVVAPIAQYAFRAFGVAPDADTLAVQKHGPVEGQHVLRVLGVG